MALGLCECGCGEPTKLALVSDKSKGLVRGQPRRFIAQHHARLSPIRYVVDPETGCWLWQRAKTPAGYGVFKRDKVLHYAHRAAYEEAHGPLADDLQIHHVCRTRHCVNPDHMQTLSIEEHGRLHSRDQCR